MQIENLEDLPKEILGDWKEISKFQNLSENFIRKYQDKVNWRNISNYQKLSEDFIRDHQDKVDWTNISHHQTLSEDFIREFQDKVNWAIICTYQKLSEDFIREFQDRVDWNEIKDAQKLSENFVKEFSLVIPKYNILNIVHYCGKNNRPIYITKNNPTKVVIGCGKFTKEKAIEAINKKYNGNEALDYINKVNECFNF